MNTIEVRRKGGLPFVISGPLIPRKVLQISYNLANLPESVEGADNLIALMINYRFLWEPGMLPKIIIEIKDKKMIKCNSGINTFVLLLSVFFATSCVFSPRRNFLSLKDRCCNTFSDYCVGTFRNPQLYDVWHEGNHFIVGIPATEDTLCFIKRKMSGDDSFKKMDKTDEIAAEIERVCLMFRDIRQNDNEIALFYIRINQMGDLLLDVQYKLTQERYTLIVTKNELPTALKGFEYQFKNQFNESFLYGKPFIKLDEYLYYRLECQ